jgi:hypothetical protein
MSPAMALADQARHFLQSYVRVDRKWERRGQIGANDPEATQGRWRS